MQPVDLPEPFDVFVISESKENFQLQEFSDEMKNNGLTFTFLFANSIDFHAHKLRNLLRSKVVIFAYAGERSLSQLSRQCLKHMREVGKGIVVDLYSRTPPQKVSRHFSGLPVVQRTLELLDWLSLEIAGRKSRLDGNGDSDNPETSLLAKLPPQLNVQSLSEPISLPKRKREVVICYSHSDKQAVEKLERYLAKKLRRHGLEPWYDKSITGDANISIELAARIRWCWSQLIVWSSSSTVSEWVVSEAHYGRELAKQQVHAIIQPCFPPPPFAGRRHFRITIGNPHPTPGNIAQDMVEALI
jgi:hypothetical protein